MKQTFRMTVVGTIVVVLAMTGSVMAQKEKGRVKPQPPQEQVVTPPTQPATQSPVERRGRTIFDYKDELRLSDEQVRRIREILAELNRETTILNAKLILVNADIEDLIKKDGDMGLIKSKVRESFDLQASIRIVDMEASRKINAVMTPEQLKNWRAIQAAARK